MAPGDFNATSVRVDANGQQADRFLGTGYRVGQAPCVGLGSEVDKTVSGVHNGGRTFPNSENLVHLTRITKVNTP